MKLEMAHTACPKGSTKNLADCDFDHALVSNADSIFSP
jgi:hypothetical protein